MAPEERLSEAIDRMLTGEGMSGEERALLREEEQLLALARRVRAAQSEFWPSDVETFKRRLLDNFQGRPWMRFRRSLAAGAAAAAVIAALLLGQTGTPGARSMALLLPPRPVALAQSPVTMHTKALKDRTSAAASFVEYGPVASAAASPAAPSKTVTVSGAATSDLVARIPVEPLAARDLGFGLVAVALPAPDVLHGGYMSATSLSGHRYRLPAALMPGAKGSATALIQTSGLPGGWYRLQTAAGEAALFVPAPGVTVPRGGWMQIAQVGPGLPFAVRFGPTRTEVAVSTGAVQTLQLLTSGGAESPLWSSVRTVEGRQAVVLVFNPTPAGVRELRFLIGGQERVLALP